MQPPLEPAQRTSWRSSRFVVLVSHAYSTVGLLAILSVVALIGGLLVQSASAQLPMAYTWLQPLRALKQVALSAGFPLLAGLAYILGVCSQRGWASLKSWLHAGIAYATDRRMLLLRGFAFVVVFALDVLWAPKHGPADALVLAIMGAAIVRPWSRQALGRAALHAAFVVLVFVAVCYWFTVVKALTFVGQNPRDPLILKLEQAIFGVLPHRWVAAWAAQSPGWLHWLDWIYFRIFEHMALTTALLLGRGDVRARNEYLASLAICYFLGAPLYLTFPAAGPVYFDPGAFRFLQQQELLVNSVQAALFRNTGGINEGRATILHTWAYIACVPSLHMAHELVMLWFARVSKPALLLAFGFTALTGVAVVALGWHYPTDIVAGAALAALAIGLARWQSARLLPRALARDPGVH